MFLVGSFVMAPTATMADQDLQTCPGGFIPNSLEAFSIHPSKPLGLAFTRAGDITSWDLEKYKTTKTFSHSSGYGMAWYHTKPLIIFLDAAGEAAVLNYENGLQVARLPMMFPSKVTGRKTHEAKGALDALSDEVNENIRSLEVSRDDKFAVGVGERYIYTWDLASYVLIRKLRLTRPGRAVSAAFPPTDFVIGFSDGSVDFLNRVSSKSPFSRAKYIVSSKARCPNEVSAVKHCAPKKVFAFGCQGRAAIQHLNRPNENVLEFFSNKFAVTKTLEFDHSCARLALTVSDEQAGGVAVFDVQSQKMLAKFDATAVVSGGFFAASSQVFIASENGDVKFFNVSTKRLLKSIHQTMMPMTKEPLGCD